VIVENGVPVACDCTGFQYNTTKKHLVAVAIREPVLQAARAGEIAVEADGGVITTDEDTDDTDERPDDCGCWDPKQGLPCWPCWRDEFRQPNPSATRDDE
jgi:hypothetical protein